MISDYTRYKLKRFKEDPELLSEYLKTKLTEKGNQKMPKLFKSKTVNFNALAAAVVTILSAFGVTISGEVITAILTLGNFFLRLKTNQAISEK